MGVDCAGFAGSAWLYSSCPLGYKYNLSRLQDLPKCRRLSSGRVFPPFVRSLALSLVRCLQIWLYFAFLGGFSAVWAFRVGLCCLRALRGLCGFCVREWLGGLEACGVFALLFVSFTSFFVLCHSLCFPPVALSVSLLLCLCCCFFPYGLYVKRKGRKGFSLRPLFVCCGLLYLVAALYSSYSSGVSPSIS